MLRDAGTYKNIVVLTGAGISASAGLPTYRGPGGLWSDRDLAALSHTSALQTRRRRATDMFWSMRSALAGLVPTPAHRALAAFEAGLPPDARFTIITQNVDGLHQRAGSSPERVVEIHGTIHEVVCLDCGERAPMERALGRVRAGEEDPPCRSCGGILKSATISFGQNLVDEDIRRAQRAALTCDLLLAIGSTLSVYPVAGVVPLARDAGARIVIVNGEPTAMDDIADAVLRGPIGELLPRLVAEEGEGATAG